MVTTRPWPLNETQSISITEIGEGHGIRRRFRVELVKGDGSVDIDEVLRRVRNAARVQNPRDQRLISTHNRLVWTAELDLE